MAYDSSDIPLANRKESYRRLFGLDEAKGIYDNSLTQRRFEGPVSLG